jgi:MFS family permease
MALAMMADNIEHVISYWVIFEKFQSPTLGGFAVLSHWLPFLFFSVYFGALADRYDCRKMIQIALVMFMAVSLGWGVLFLTDTIELWHAAVLLTIHGFAGVIWGPATQLLIHDLVGGKDLQSAIRLNSTSRHLGVLLGPGIGGGLMLWLGPPVGLLVNALIYLPLFLWLFKAPGRVRTEHAPQRGMGSFKAAFDALREVSGNRTIVTMIVLAGCSSFLVGNAFQAQMPEFAHDLGSEKADVGYSALLAANAAGAFIGGIVLESRNLLRASPRSAIIITILWCISVLGFAVATSYAVALTMMLVAGFLNLTSGAMAQTLVQLQSPAHLRGRLIGLYNMALNGMRSFSGVTVGMLGAIIGIHWSLALSAVALIAAAFFLLAFLVKGRS